jgi:hypothetical protein
VALACLGIVLALSVVRAIRRQIVRVEYSLVWLFGASLFVFLVLQSDWMDRLAVFVGLPSAPLAIVLLAVSLLAFVCFHYAMILSRLRDDNIALVQRVAVLEFHLRQSQQSISE